MSELPMGWTKTTLGDVADWGSGGTPSRSESSFYGGTIPWIKSGELNSRYISTTEEFITEAAIKNSSAKLFPAGSVAIAMYGATIGKTAILGVDASTNQACAVGAPTEGVIGKEFLYRLLQNEKEAFIEKGKGGAQPNISQAVIKAHEVSLPPLAEQTRIVQKLDEVLAQVGTLKTRIDSIPPLLKRFRQSVLAAAVSGRLTEEWRSLHPERSVLSLEHLVHGLKTSGFKPKAKGVEPVQISEIPGWLKIPLGSVFSVKSGSGLTAKEMNESGDIPVYGGNGVNGQHTEHNVITRTVVIGRVGYYCGSVHFTPTKAWVTDNALIVSYPDTLFNLNYIYWLLLGTNLRKNTSSSAQPVISGEKIYPIGLNIAPLEEQTEIVRRIEQLLAVADQVEAKVASAKSRIDHLTQSILAKAFRGELVPQDPNDEPASVLLERIKAQRAAAPKAKRGRKVATSDDYC
ncbi:restriction endonuclease subunit S [Pseudomonas sp. RW409]|uniref:restriction endonuclease subunit S n=1 Tax=Pseudomonas sp. RW409 TaxID=2202895 RepID=UPI001C441F5B|nr:restriction endonuclease subunit S [Pseudomonas sp. RW409]